MRQVRKRTISECIGILTYVWIKWVDSHNNANNVALSVELRAASARRCETMQKVRRMLIEQIDYLVADNFAKTV